MKQIIDIPDELFSIFKKHGIMAFDYVNEYDKDQIAIAITQSTPYNPSGDCISREALKEAVSKVVAEERKEDEKWATGLRYALKLIDNAQAVEQNWRFYYDHGYKQAEKDLKRPKGEWKHIGGDEWVCSECGHVITTEGSWENPLSTGAYHCENCGADLRPKGGKE